MLFRSNAFRHINNPWFPMSRDTIKEAQADAFSVNDRSRSYTDLLIVPVKSVKYVLYMTELGDWE